MVYDDFIVHPIFSDDKFRPYLMPPQICIGKWAIIIFLHVGKKKNIYIDLSDTFADLSVSQR